MKLLIVAAYGLDIAIGDPSWLPHPVRWIGMAATHGEPLARRRFSTTPNGERFAGAVLTGVIVAASAGTAAILLALVRRADRRAARVLEIVAAASALATHDLLKEAGSVMRALRAGDLALARARVARIVGRDTEDLDAAGIARAVIETLAESMCDGIVAPLFFLACGGAPAALAFKAISTLDSMIGHPEPPYRFFGTAAARLDDVANYLPARLSAVFIALVAPVCGGSFLGAIACARNDARTHRSPNAGFPEAALAGALGVRLGGPLFYDGAPYEAAPLNGNGRAPQAGDIAAAMRVSALASVASATLFFVCARRA